VPTKSDQAIVIVTGLPRSGTSLMMKILEEGGIETVQDNIRQPDIDNPNGYYEFEKVKKIKEDTSWLPETRGKAFKMVSMLLFHLPAGYSYKLIFMRRDIQEMLASQSKMLKRLGKPGPPVSDDEMALLFTKHLQDFELWIPRQKNFELIYVWHHDLMCQPRVETQRIEQLLGRPLDTDKMTSVVDPSLYRNRVEKQVESFSPAA
jgi:hypothetical protein